jgi:hypothetical protein
MNNLSRQTRLVKPVEFNLAADLSLSRAVLPSAPSFSAPINPSVAICHPVIPLSLFRIEYVAGNVLGGLDAEGTPLFERCSANWKREDDLDSLDRNGDIR